MLACIPIHAGIWITRNVTQEAIMTIALVFVSVSVVTPVSFAASVMDAFGVRVLLMAVPLELRSQRPKISEPPHAMVSSMTVDPARVPMPTLTCSCASSLLAPSPDAMMTAASGTAPRMGRSNPPTSPGDRISRSSSEPSEMNPAAVSRA